MRELRERILSEGQYIGNNILKLDSFLNHQVDPFLMSKMGIEFWRLFHNAEPTKILTAAVSGIAPAVHAAASFGVPLIFARKARSITQRDVYVRYIPSPTKGGDVQLIVSKEFLCNHNRVLILDDFLATGKTIEALADIVLEAGATLVGIGVVIEKSFQGGRDALQKFGVPIHALTTIVHMNDTGIVLDNGS